MDSSFEHLSVFAEVAAALVGFVAIFLVLVRREGKFPAEDAIRMRVMVLVGFAGICLSLLPIAIAETSLDHVQVWIISSAAFIVMVGSIAVYTAVRHFQLPDAARENIPWSNLLIGWSCVAAAGGLLVSNLLQAPILGYSFSYTASLLLLLAIGATNFYTIAIQKLLEL
ncbi:MAG: hypothetical protein V2I63_04430 [Pseudomonadales bacterium]|nr:hypothetical protein [Pseudomonadales bacterium]